jgi:hypothetical protein
MQGHAQALFRTALGRDFNRLAEVLQLHYDLAPGYAVRVEGEMNTWNRLGALHSLVPLSPKTGKAHVRMLNRGLVDDHGQVCFEWRREFHFADGQQSTYTLTKPAPHNSPHHVLDTFVQFPPMAVLLRLDVSQDGRTLTQTAAGPQYALFGGRRIRLPGVFALKVVAMEQALSEQRIYTEVTISHPLLGNLFGYAGKLDVICEP